MCAVLAARDAVRARLRDKLIANAEIVRPDNELRAFGESLLTRDQCPLEPEELRVLLIRFRIDFVPFRIALTSDLLRFTAGFSE